MPQTNYKNTVVREVENTDILLDLQIEMSWLIKSIISQELKYFS